MRKKRYRVGVVGSGGTGKTTLGMVLSEKLDIPFLASKKVTQEILRKEGYDYNSGVQVERFLAQGSRQDRIFKRTVEEQKKHVSFVTDRTVIDLAAYAIVELYDSDPKKVEKMFRACNKHVSRYTHIVVCPWGIKPLLDNKLRTLNSWYQYIISSLCLNILNHWRVPFHVLQSLDERQRIKEVLKFLQRR